MQIVQYKSMLGIGADPPCRVWLRETRAVWKFDPGSDSTESSNSEVGEAREIPFNQDPSLHAVDALAFDTALRELRGVVGDDVSEDLLRDLLLAADMDTNRAVNYYFNTQGSI